jgi:hypothetical protein
VNPFASLGLPPAPGLTDEEVRAAWRRAAARTHPDRDDGGDPAAYTAAATAYAQLRTPWGRSEALADLAPPDHVPPAAPAAVAPGTAALRWLAILPARVRHGRPLRLAARAIAAAAAALLALAVIPGSPSVPAIIVGCALWVAFTARADLAPPPGR